MQAKNEQLHSFSERLKLTLKSKGLKNKVLAEKMNVDPVVISRYCKGLHIPDSRVLHNMAKILGVSMEYLMGDSESELNQDAQYWKRKYEEANIELCKLREAVKLLVNQVSK